MTAAELDERMNDALAREDMDAFERFAQETDRREAKRDSDRARRAAAREAREEQRAAELERLYDEGVDDEIAVERVTGRTVEQQRRSAAIAQLKADGHRGKSFDALSRDSWKHRLYGMYDDAETATNGYMLSPEGKRAGWTEAALFTATDDQVRKYASPELKEWFDQVGRPSLAEHRAELLGDNQSAYRERNARGDYYQ